MKTQIGSIILVIFSGMIGAFGPIYLKKASSSISLKKISTIYKNPYLILGILISLISAALFIPALKGGELSVLYPLVGLSYVWVCVYSIFLLKEKMNITKWIGIILVILGVFFIGIGA